MVHVIQVYFMFLAVFKNMKLSFSEDNMPGYFHWKRHQKGLGFPIKRENALIKLLGSTKTLYFPIQCNGNYRGPWRNDYNAFGVVDTVFHSGEAWDSMP